MTQASVSSVRPGNTIKTLSARLRRQKSAAPGQNPRSRSHGADSTLCIPVMAIALVR